MSGLYKSRLFNFLNRQKNRFSNRLGITWRHLQLATETGVQILLYPVSLITRTNISDRQQLQSDDSSSATKINLVQQKIVSEDDCWWPDEDCNSSTDLSKSNSVSTLASDRPVTPGIARKKQTSFRAIAPIRFFQKILNWVKTNPLATNSNLIEEGSKESFSLKDLIGRAIAYFFGDKQQLLSGKNQEALPSTKEGDSGIIESLQANSPLVNNSQADKSQLSLLSQVSSWLEKLKSNISFSSSLTQKSSEPDFLAIQTLISKAIAYFFGDKQQLLSGKNQEALPSTKEGDSGIIESLQANFSLVNNSQADKSQLSLLSQVSSWLEKLKSNISFPSGLTQKSSEPDFLAIQTLISKAIAYFWKKKQVNNSYHLPGHSFTTLPFSTFTTPIESQKLSFSLPFNTCNLQLSDEPQLETISIWEKFLPTNKLSAEIIQNLSCFVATANLSAPHTTEQTNIIGASDYSDSLVTNIPLEFAADFWEAEVTTVGYAKNILEKILEFFDQITWWLEKQFLKLWRFFKQVFSF